MQTDVIACNLISLCRADGEVCFEQVRAEVWFRGLQKSPFDKVYSIIESVPTRSELPMEALLMQRYAKRLMTAEKEEQVANAWSDPFISAEFYIQIKCLTNKTTSPNEMRSSTISGEEASLFKKVYHGPSRVPDCLDSPLFESDENVVQNRFRLHSDGSDYSPSKCSLHEDHGSGLSHTSFGQILLNRKSCHLIDVSNYFLEQSLRDNELLQNATTTPTGVTQLFSPRQVRELIMKQSVFGRIIETQEEEAPVSVDPWCSSFVDMFWSKVAPRVSLWSSYSEVKSLSPPRSVFQFGQQRYSKERHLGSGASGSVYLVQLLPSQANLTDPNNGDTDFIDTTIVGCLPEQQQRQNNIQFSGILRVVKFAAPGFPLEFYYMREARKRVATAFTGGRIAIDVRPSICPALALTHSVDRFTCLLMPFYSVGLLNWLNYGISPCHPVTSKKTKTGKEQSSSLNPLGHPKLSPPSLSRHDEELVALYLSIELLWIVEGLHKHARMIHGDIKPDNFRINDRFPLLDISALDEATILQRLDEEGVEEAKDEIQDFTDCLMSGRCTRVLVLLDFGLCIDMARFPPETVFKIDDERLARRPFPCIEMLTKQPWTYQLDLFNIAGVIYTLVFKRYMEVECSNGQWRPKFLPRSSRVYRAIEVWRDILYTMLNVRSCAPSDYPDIGGLRKRCESFLRDNAAEYNVAAERANAIISYLDSTDPSFV